jgi:hypothetical protein
MVLRKIAMLAGAGTLLAMSASGAYAATVAADYTKAITTDGDEGVVSSFNIYDFAVGVTLLRPDAGNAGTVAAPIVGDTYTGYYQSYVTAHQLDGIVQTSLGLNTSGSGAGYELTVMAQFTEVITSVGAGGVASAITGGFGSIYFDTSPNYNFLTDSGFDDGELILSGTIVSGESVVLPSIQSGFAQISLVMDNQSSAIFNPDIASATGIFTLALDSDAVRGITSVHGLGVLPNDMLLGTDGNLELQPVPLPAAVWLLGSAFIGMTSLRRRAAKA